MTWVLFLVFFPLAWVVISFYMTTGTFAATKGLEYKLLPVKVSENDFESARRGEAITDGQGGLVVDPQRDTVCFAEVSADGRLAVNGQDTTDFRECCIAARNRNGGLGFVLIRVDQDALYQALVGTLDQLAAAKRGISCPLQTVVVAGEAD